MAKSDEPIDWDGIERDFRAGVMSVREIARWYQVTHTAINKKAKEKGWTREKRKGPFQEAKEQRARVPAEIIPPDRVKPETLTDRAKEIAGRILDELDSVTTHVGEFEELICNEEGDPRRRQALLKAISMPERASTLKNLATALKTLNEVAQPEGKKAARQAGAEAATAPGSKFAPRQAPRMVVNNSA